MTINKDYQIIDNHLHIRGGFEDLDDVFEAMKKITEPFESSVMLSIPQFDYDSVGQNAVCLLYKALNPENTYAFAGMDYHVPGTAGTEYDFKGEVERFMNMGFDGIKMIEGKPSVRKIIGNLPLDSPLFDEFYGYLEENRIPILSHVADPEESWDVDKSAVFAKQNGWFYGDRTYVEKEALYEELERVLNKFPSLNITFAHFHFLSADIERAADYLDRWPNVFFDLTPGSEMYGNFSKDPDKWHDFFTKYQDRIIFGTDNGWGTETPHNQKVIEAAEKVDWMRRFLETDDTFVNVWGMNITGIKLDREVLEKLYATNYKRFVNFKPKKVNISLATEYSQDLMERFNRFIEDDPRTKQLNNVFKKFVELRKSEINNIEVDV
jgi:predicted TIM-barrel fold metal-dependent hydrolase